MNINKYALTVRVAPETKRHKLHTVRQPLAPWTTLRTALLKSKQNEILFMELLFKSLFRTCGCDFIEVCSAGTLDWTCCTCGLQTNNDKTNCKLRSNKAWHAVTCNIIYCHVRILLCIIYSIVILLEHQVSLEDFRRWVDASWQRALDFVPPASTQCVVPVVTLVSVTTPSFLFIHSASPSLFGFIQSLQNGTKDA